MTKLSQKNGEFELGVKDYKELIDEARRDGFHNIANMWIAELDKLLANEQIVGNKPKGVKA